MGSVHAMSQHDSFGLDCSGAKCLVYAGAYSRNWVGIGWLSYHSWLPYQTAWARSKQAACREHGNLWGGDNDGFQIEGFNNFGDGKLHKTEDIIRVLNLNACSLEATNSKSVG